MREGIKEIIVENVGLSICLRTLVLTFISVRVKVEFQVIISNNPSDLLN